jgi:hypothetical protein
MEETMTSTQAARPVRPNRAPATKRARVRFRLKQRTLSTEQAIALVTREPDKLAAEAKPGLTIEASPSVLGLGRAAGLGQLVGNDGEVETEALTGLEEALIVIAVIGFFSGLAVGYLKGYEDGQQAAAEAQDEGDDGGGDDGQGEGGEGAGDGGEESGGGRD